MVIANFQGRLGNNLFQFFAAYFFSKKHEIPLYINDIGVFYVNGNSNLFKIISKYQTEYIPNNKETIIINDKNFFEFFENENLPDVNFSFIGYFLFKNFILPKREEIKSILEIKYENQNDDVFIHYRLGDIKNSILMLPLEYYTNALELLGNPKGYLSSDTIEHENCQYLINNYDLNVLDTNPWDTILFAKNFNKLILSEGTFSSLINLLSNSNEVITNSRDLSAWGGGDIFSGFNNSTNLFYDYTTYPNYVKK